MLGDWGSLGGSVDGGGFEGRQSVVDSGKSEGINWGGFQAPKRVVGWCMYEGLGEAAWVGAV